MSRKEFLSKNGEFVVGSNYWASHAGTDMWKVWQPEIVEQDMDRLHNTGIQVLRVFPIWPDFQPLNILRKYNGIPLEYRHGEKALEDDEEGRAGVSTNSILHFEEFVKLADKYQIKLIVGLITGWMSGRLFVPQAFEGRNIITDPVAVMWQIRFVKYFVKHFKDCTAISAWELGNECNCMAEVPGKEAAWCWTSAIVNAICSIDQSRPIISGMHSLGRDGTWTIQDQAELTDILTTHPYPVFTPYCDYDPANTMRPLLHGTAESCLYSDIGNKPCLIEEINTLGPMVSSEAITADFARINLFSGWAHNCGGLLWWCAFDQDHLTNAPYDLYSVERELGLLRSDGTSKPVLSEVERFCRFLKELPFESLPPRIKDCVCILTEDQDIWGVAYSTFILSKQAGIDIEFQYQSQPLKESNMYLMPCISGPKVISRQRMTELMDRVNEGASLYISYNGGFLSHFEKLTGVRVETRQRRTVPEKIFMEKACENSTYYFGGEIGLKLDSIWAEVLGKNIHGNPAFTRAGFGKGKVYFLALPMELELIKSPGSIHSDKAQPFWQIYKYLSGEVKGNRVLTKDNPQIGVTEHIINDKSRLVIMINYSPEPVDNSFMLASGWETGEILYGNKPELKGDKYCILIEKNEALVFKIFRPVHLL